MVEMIIDFDLKDKRNAYQNFDVWFREVCKQHQIKIKEKEELCLLSGYQKDLIRLFQDIIVFENKTYEDVLKSY